MEVVANITSSVTSVLNQMKKFGVGETDRPWLTNIAIRFHSDKFSGFQSPSLRSMAFPVTHAVKHWPWPLDYMMYTKIAYKCYGGVHAYVLALNSDMDISGSLGACSTPIQDLNAPLEGGYYFADGWQQGYGNTGQAMFATGGGFAANYYRVDNERRCIRFNDELPVGNAFIEYISNGGNVTGETFIHPAFRGAFEDYLKWQVCNLDPAMKQFAEGFRRDYKIQVWDSKIMTDGLSIQEVRDTINSASGFNLNR